MVASRSASTRRRQALLERLASPRKCVHARSAAPHAVRPPLSSGGFSGGHPGKVESGFTLLEVLVAITIMALLLASLLPVFQRGMRALEASDVRTQAMLLAQARLAEAGVIRELTPAPGASMQAEGEHGRFRWQLQMEPYTSDETVGDDADVAARDDTGGDARDFGPVPDDVVGIWDTRVEVHWEDGAKTPSVVLRTLKLGPLE